MNNSDLNSPRRFSINLISNIVMFCIDVGVGIWFVPYLIKNLGLGAYGLVALAISISTAILIAGSAINNALGRFLTIELRRRKTDAANRVLNTVFWPTIGLIAVFIIAIPVFSLSIPYLFDTPPGLEEGSRWLFLCVLFAFVFYLLRSVFSTSTFAHNRFDLMTLILAVNIIVRVVFIVVVFNLVEPDIRHVGVGILIGACISVGIAIMIWRRLTPELGLALHLFDRSRLHVIFSMGGWTIVNQVGAFLIMTMGLVVVNTSLGASVQGGYASAMQWSILLRRLAATSSTVLVPIAVGYFAESDTEKLLKLSSRSIKLQGLALALPVGLILGLAEPLLRVWLGQDFTDLSILLVVLTAPLCITLAMHPIFSIQTALNKVKWPAIVTLLIGMVFLLLAFWWVNWESHGLGVALAGALVLLVKNSIFTPIYGALILKQPWQFFFNKLLLIVVCTTLIWLVSFTIANITELNTWFTLCGVGSGIGLVYTVGVYFIVLTNAEKEFLKKLICFQR